MSKKIFMDAFFTQFHAFMGELIRVFPDDADYRWLFLRHDTSQLCIKRLQFCRVFLSLIYRFRSLLHRPSASGSIFDVACCHALLQAELALYGCLIFKVCNAFSNV